ncbi:iron ABC transporter permease [Paenibacillus campi]|uniref:ABC transporter permease n=1 Tax=Paenibacillus campi TaxID=3106031 RepID=UPI002AFFEA7C|nr:iron ABC transporter permease [Paenibacillus sp. SGZ-1009]
MMHEMLIRYRLKKQVAYIGVMIALLWAIFTFLIYPNLELIRTTLMPQAQFNIQPMMNILASARAMNSLSHSLLLGCSLAITVALLGLFQILVLDYFYIKGSRWLTIAYHSPLICNGMVLVMAYNFLYGSQGFVTALLPGLPATWFQGFWAVLIELTFAGTSNYILFVRNSLRSVDNQTIEAARNLGVSKVRILIKIVLPCLKPALLAASIIAFITGISALATPQVLGGTNFETINTLIYSFAQTLTTRNYAAVLAILLGCMTVTVLLISIRIEKKGYYLSVSKVKTNLSKQTIRSPFIRITMTIIAHLIALMQTVPLVAVFCFSFMPVTDLYAGSIQIQHFSLANYEAVFQSVAGVQPLFTSIVYAATASLLIVLLMLCIGRLLTKHANRWTGGLEFLLQIPWFLPSTLIALGLLMTFNRSNPLVGGMVLTGTVFILLIGYMILVTPYTLRMIKAAYASIDRTLEDAAQNLGASSWRMYWKVVFPMLLPLVLSVFLLNFIGLLAEYDLSVFLFHPLYQPLGVVLNAATNPEAAPQAQMLSFVYSVLIMIVSTTAIVLVYRQQRR